MQDQIDRLRSLEPVLNGPASEESIAALTEAAGGSLPTDLLSLYRDHDGCISLAMGMDGMLPARLMPIDEALRTNLKLGEFYADDPKLGPLIWLWTDDNSNYVGLYTDGPAAGWLTVLDHEGEYLTPAFRSIRHFMIALIGSAPRDEDDDQAAFDAPSVPPDVPVQRDDPATVEGDRRLARIFRERYERETNEDQKQLEAISAIRLTPVADTALLLPFLEDPDMYTPAEAVDVLRMRQYHDAIPALSRLAEHGSYNGHSMAMGALVEFGEPAAAEIERLQSVLTGDKKELLEQRLRRPPHSP